MAKVRSFNTGGRRMKKYKCEECKDGYNLVKGFTCFHCGNARARKLLPIKLIWAQRIKKIAKNKHKHFQERLFEIIAYCDEEEKAINERYDYGKKL